MRIVRLPRGEVLQLVDGAVDVGGEGHGANDADDFESFYRREYPHLLVLARVMAGPAVADDVVQETMLTAYHQWEDVQSYASPVGWLRTVCLRKAVNVVRRRSVERRVLGVLRNQPAAPVADVGDGEAFWSLVRTLPQRQAQVVALHYALDLGVAEIASTLGCAEGTVKAHLSRARAGLAEKLGTSEEDPR
ncbi:RNA polymerase sigma factor [Nocardioides mesophilus]|uniref:Sigma-70 family RNA polymerase sigma factor n=1 Tax=Nocardioides mesophilus TaxID=433659 RepID=A0A7G9RGF8_9ACTN|nr:sigma-70 family RNA polymerase sigma factor [Nocardioides mesophilus]QNN54683.1 sigma-70 family RNA polymerase sigma factor [Nocardioides mesophilus]